MRRYNLAQWSGGALSVNGGLRASATSFARNSAAKHGGAVFVNTGSKHGAAEAESAGASFTSCDFQKNEAKWDGGGVCVGSAAEGANAVAVAVSAGRCKLDPSLKAPPSFKL